MENIMGNRAIAIITGASRGIGAATALEFARRGYCTTIVGRELDSLNRVANDVTAQGVDVLPIAGDLADLQFAESVVQQTAEKWGRIDVLVNNAAWREIGTMRTINLESWEQTLRVCLTTPAFLARWTAAHMETCGRGVIVNVSSMMSQQAAGTSPAYIACKGALDALTYELASLYGPSGIRVVAINPGAVDTTMGRDLGADDAEGDRIIRQFSEDMIMLRRWATSEEIARAIAWISSDEASYLTGTTVTIDGGWQHQHLPHSVKQKQLPHQFQ
jgi:3-oxoacyl-[acyl-carrier protein] reductase